MGILTGKKALIIGVASKRSIAYGIAEAMHREGAEIALTYQTERLLSRVKEAAQNFNSSHIFPLDVSKDEDIQQLASGINGIWPEGLDILVHSVAYAPRDQLEGEYIDVVSREGFQIAHDISSYSLSALASALKKPLYKKNGSIITLTYLGAEKAVPSYNVMGVAKASLEANVRYLAQSMGPHGVRVNAVSAGAIKTLAAAGIKGFGSMLKTYEQVTPMRRNVTIQEVGNVATFLCSDWASGITGEVVHVDSGYHICGMVPS